MNPDHYDLAQKELSQLQQEGAVKPTTSQWACEAFYVNKRAEQSPSHILLTRSELPFIHTQMKLKKLRIQYQSMVYRLKLNPFSLRL